MIYEGDHMPSLPALKGLSRLADLRPCVVIDTREQTPLCFSRLPSIGGTLTSGDYSVTGLEHEFAVERKSIPDLVACCTSSNRERFERELHRLRGFRFARLLVVGTIEEIRAGDYRSNLAPKVVLHTIAAFEARYNVPVVFEPDPKAAAARVEAWSYWFTREVVESANELLRGHEQAKHEQVAS